MIYMSIVSGLRLNFSITVTFPGYFRPSVNRYSVRHLNPFFHHAFQPAYRNQTVDFKANHSICFPRFLPSTKHLHLSFSCIYQFHKITHKKFCVDLFQYLSVPSYQPFFPFKELISL